jgi:dTDP-4-dehydrorhamnose 3,5-epimerase
MANLEGVVVTPLKIIPDERGQVMHMLRADASHFKQFGEIYFSCVYPGVTKGWKLHTASWSNLAVPIGRVKFVLHDLRENSPTKGQFQEVYLGENAYQLLTTPPGVAYAWKNLVPQIAYVANCSTHVHDPEEGKMLPFSDIPYAW